MFNSTISVNELVREVISELHMAPGIYIGTAARIINSVEQLLYSEIIRRVRRIDIRLDTPVIKLTDIEVPEGEDSIRRTDVYRIFDDMKEFSRQPADDAYIMSERPSYVALSDDELRLSGVSSDTVTLFYIVRPLPKRVENGVITPDTLRLPDSFSELMASRLRGELCKLMGDDNQSAKWLNDYNTYLDDFRQYILRQG